jgi:hypothetical protein
MIKYSLDEIHASPVSTELARDQYYADLSSNDDIDNDFSMNDDKRNNNQSFEV